MFIGLLCIMDPREEISLEENALLILSIIIYRGKLDEGLYYHIRFFIVTVAIMLFGVK